MGSCPNCDHQVLDDARFCPECGVAIGETAHPDTDSTPDSSTQNVSAAAPIGAPKRKLPWILIGIAVVVLMSVVGVVLLNGSGVQKSPADVVRDFHDAYEARDAELMEATVAEDLWLALGSDIFSAVPAEMNTSFQITETGSTAVASQDGENWEMSLELSKDGRWLVRAIRVMYTSRTERSYEAGPATLKLAQLPKDVEIPLDSGQPGTLEVITKTYYLNGSFERDEQTDGDVLVASREDITVSGSGPLKNNLRTPIRFRNQIWFQTFMSIPDGYESGDVFQPFMVLPTGDFVTGDAEEWDGRLGTGFLEQITFSWEWTTDYVADAGFADAVKDGWPSGTYVVGVTVNDEPLAWAVETIR